MVNFGGLVVLGPDELLGLVSLGGPVNLVALVILGPREVSGAALPGSQQVKPCTRCCYCRDQPCCWWGKSALSVPHFSRRHNNLVITPGQPSGLATALSLISTGLTLLETPPLWYDTAMSLPAEEALVTLFNRLEEGNLTPWMSPVTVGTL